MPTNARLASRLGRGRWTRPIIRAAGRPRAAGLSSSYAPLLGDGARIIDIGAGTCGVAESLRRSGYSVVAVDVEDFSFVDDIEPVVYDGERLPFEAATFDAAVLCSVLHHVLDQRGLVAEACRVGRRLIVIEDVHPTPAHRSVASFVDRLLGLEFDGAPHRYRSDAGWRALFADAGLDVVGARRWRSMGGLFHHVAYRLEPGPATGRAGSRSREPAPRRGAMTGAGDRPGAGSR